MADAGVELAARVEAVLLSSPPFLNLLTSTSLDAGLSSTELITCSVRLSTCEVACKAE